MNIACRFFPTQGEKWLERLQRFRTNFCDCLASTEWVRATQILIFGDRAA
jgi:hypothetical protein